MLRAGVCATAVLCLLAGCGAGQGRTGAIGPTTTAGAASATSPSTAVPAASSTSAARPPSPTATTAPPASTTQPTIAFDPCPPTTKAASPPRGVSVTVRTDKEVYERDEPVVLTMTLRNDTGATLQRSWPRGTTDHDLWLSTPSRAVLWRWSHGDEFSGSGPNHYAPGEGETWTERWERDVCRGDGKVVPPQRAPGTYTLRGSVRDTEVAWSSNEVTFTVR